MISEQQDSCFVRSSVSKHDSEIYDQYKIYTLQHKENAGITTVLYNFK